jgi:hypothetical protein
MVGASMLVLILIAGLMALLQLATVGGEATVMLP